MEKLEDVLMQVERLRGNEGLCAEIVLQEEEGHWSGPQLGEEVYAKGGYYAGSSPWGSLPGEKAPSWIVDKPRITEPNIKKREVAREQLKNASKSSENYIKKYLAIEILSNPRHLSSMLEEVIEKLKKDLNAGSYEERTGVGTIQSSYNQYGPPLEDFIPNIEIQNKAREELINLYHNFSDAKIKKLAGKALGYSQLRILIHQFLSRKK